MSCRDPRNAYKTGSYHEESGKEIIAFKIKDFKITDPERQIIKVPCGQCAHCRAEKARQWAFRSICESSLYDDNCFITLTYNDKNIPHPFKNRDCKKCIDIRQKGQDKIIEPCKKKGTLCHYDFQLFFKRLRKKYGKEIRYYMCGEYGKKLLRPHYHILLFNFDFPDKEVWSVKRVKDKAYKVFRSQQLEKLWPYGFSTIGELNYQTAGYVSRYIMKKWNGVSKEMYYKGLKPEYTNMSRKKGIGKDWFDKFKTDLYNKDRVVINGSVSGKPPKYFDLLLEKEDEVLYKEIKDSRKEKSKNRSYDLESEDKILKKRLSLLEREMENGEKLVCDSRC
jgi:hypothetical protein